MLARLGEHSEVVTIAFGKWAPPFARRSSPGLEPGVTEKPHRVKPVVVREDEDDVPGALGGDERGQEEREEQDGGFSWATGDRRPKLDRIRAPFKPRLPDGGTLPPSGGPAISRRSHRDDPFLRLLLEAQLAAGRGDVVAFFPPQGRDDACPGEDLEEGFLLLFGRTFPGRPSTVL